MKKRDKEKRIMLIMLAISLLAAAVLILLGLRTEEKFVGQTYTVEHGDTLDGLYYRYGSGNLEKWRYEVKKLNGMEESGLYAGSEIIILVSEGECTWKSKH